MMKKVKNEAKGTIWYGMHMYPGVAEYAEEDQKPYRVCILEDTIRSMGPSFAGKPVFVLHVDEIEKDLNKLREEADGWVIESFYNKADGKHWAKFITCSEKAEEAIEKGMKLSNCYLPKGFGPGGTWNGLSYDREITSAEYEHLAIVPNPRYEESIIMSPDQFKKYNDDKLSELTKLANNKQGDGKMKFSFFKRAKVENSADLDSMSVVLPKSGKEIALERLINEADEKEMKKDEPKMAHPEHMVEVDGKKMTVNDLVKAYKDACEGMKKMHDDDMDPSMENEEDQDMETAKKEVPKSDSEKEGEKETLKLEEEEEKEVKDAKKNEEDEAAKEKEEKKKNAKEKADRLKNAPDNAHQYEVKSIMLSGDQVQRGKARYGSN
jgi:Uncharacterized protein conserved in bacteria (DUF2213)